MEAPSAPVTPFPAAFSGTGKAWKQDAIERSVSTSNQPQHAVITGVWDMPFGKTILAANRWERAVFGGFKFSEIFQIYSGSPLPITASACSTNPAQNAFSTPSHLHAELQSHLHWPRLASMANGVRESPPQTSAPPTALSLNPPRISSSMFADFRPPQTSSSATRPVPLLTTSTALATTSSTSASFAASRCTSASLPS